MRDLQKLDYRFCRKSVYKKGAGQRAGSSRSHGKEPAKRFSLGQSEGTSGLIVKLRGGIEAKAPENCGGQIRRRDWIQCREGPDAIAGAVDRAAPHTAAGQEHAVAIGPVISAGAPVDTRRATELA
jgi:hypothetical protein